MLNTSTTLFDAGGHRNVLLPDFSAGGVAVQANQHLIIHGGEGMILDPGGHKVYSKVLGATSNELRGAKLRYLFLSHQDPDIVAASNGWLMTTDADAYISALWTRFVPHFGLDRQAMAVVLEEDVAVRAVVEKNGAGHGSASGRVERAGVRGRA